MKFYWLSKLVPLAVVTAGLSSLGAAQASGPTGGTLAPTQQAHHGKHPIVIALEQLNLAPKQKSQITGMLKQRKADDRTFRKANPGNLAAIKAHNRQETQALMSNLKGVLSPSQWQQFEANLKALKGRGKRTSPSGAAGANPPVQP